MIRAWNARSKLLFFYAIFDYSYLRQKPIIAQLLSLDEIFSLTTDTFDETSIRVFQDQYENVPVYREYCDYLGVSKVSSVHEIPFLPIQFFKSKVVIRENKEAQEVFMSSGTTGQHRSCHYVVDLEVYRRSFMSSFRSLIAPPEDSIILALLPNYLEQGQSSLVYMVNHLITLSNNHLSGFYLDDQATLIDIITQSRRENKRIILFGVTYALMDLAEKKLDLSDVTVIETGGMKGRRKELIRSELHEILKSGFNLDRIYSEYGMTELLSQGYMNESGYFQTPEWMKVVIRDVNDPFQRLPHNKTGGVNVIDLANIHSCSFIATDDLGITTPDGFNILGRFDVSDIRGCNLLVN